MLGEATRLEKSEITIEQNLCWARQIFNEIQSRRVNNSPREDEFTRGVDTEQRVSYQSNTQTEAKRLNIVDVYGCFER